jgi:hypothetical protein
MDRDAHVDRQWVCGVYSQLEWFSNANALVIAVVAPFASSAVQRAYMRLTRFPWSPHMYLRCARSLRRVCVSHVGAVFACVPNAAPRGVCVPNALDGGCACKIQRKSGVR